MILASDCNVYHLRHHIHPILQAGDVTYRDDDMYILGFWCDTESAVKMYEDRFAKAHHVVIHWAGSDIVKLKRLHCKARALKLLNRPQARHFAGRKELADEVSEVLGRKCRVISEPTSHIAPEPFPLPEQFAVGVYYPDHRRSLYGLDCTDEVIRSLPDVQFYLYYVSEAPKPEIAYRKNVTWLGRIDDDKYMDFLKTVSVLLRLTSHDGMPYSVVEYQCAGRHCITQQRFPWCFKVDREVEQIVFTIKMLQGLEHIGSRYWRAYNDHDKFRKAIKEILR